MAIYFGQNQVGQLAIGTLNASGNNITLASPVISIDNSTGLITATVTQSSSGYLSSGQTTSTSQLSTQSATTITPSNSLQTAVAANKFTTGAIKVAAVPTETQFITSNGTYTPSNGKYFSSVTVDVSGAIPTMTLPTAAAASASGTTKATITPSGSAQYINIPVGYNSTEGSYTINPIPSNYIVPTGSLAITANGSNINVANYATVDVDVSSTSVNIVKGVIRPDAELVQTFSWDEWAVADLDLTIPAYSTSAQTLQTGGSIGTYSIDYANYDYFVLEKFLTIPKYATGTGTGKGRVEYASAAYLYEVMEIPANTYYAISNTAKLVTSRSVSVYAVGAAVRSIYWSSSSALAAYATSAYTTAQTVVAPTISSSVMTVNKSTRTMRGSTTYFVNTYFNAIEDIRYQGIIEIYRAPKNNLNLDGWGLKHVMSSMANDVHNNNQTLT